jgi:hypothetical protein
MSDSSTVFELRRAGRLEEALLIANNLYGHSSDDPWVQKALAWTLIDLCKLALRNHDYKSADLYFTKIAGIRFSTHDDILEEQIKILFPKVDPLYEPVQNAEDLSKSGKREEALALMQEMLREGKLQEKHHEAYGWIIYRLIKDAHVNNKTIPTRTLLRDYLELKNERPSMLHSIILQFAISYFTTNKDFKLTNFFLLWGPKNLTHEDISDTFTEDKRYSSTLFKLFRELAEADLVIEPEALEKSGMQLGNIRVLDGMREPYYWNLLRTGKENHFQELWVKLDRYACANRGLGGSLYHSKILSIALFTMKDKEEYRFLNFFSEWNPKNLTEDDWKEVKKDQKAYKPLALQALKKAHDCMKISRNYNLLQPMLSAYAKAIIKYPQDNFLNRDYALFLVKDNQLEKAAEIYRKLVIELAAQPYIWHEFSSCVTAEATGIRIGMLAKALSLQNDEAYLGDIRIDLATVLLESGRGTAALAQLKIYSSFRLQKRWPLGNRYAELVKLTENITENDDVDIFTDYIKTAEDFAFSAYEWTEVVAVEKWTDDKKRETMLLTNGNTISFITNSNRFSILNKAGVGSTFRCRVLTTVENQHSRFSPPVYHHTPLVIDGSDTEPWSPLPELVAVADYINSDKKIVHAITPSNEEIFFRDATGKLQKGNFIRARYYIKASEKGIRMEVCEPSLCEKKEAMPYFKQYLAVVDSVNIAKELFHYVVSPKIQGLVKFEEAPFVPDVGSILNIVVVSKKDQKNNKIIYRTLDLTLSDDSSPLKKNISGLLELKYKRNGVTLGSSDLEFDTEADFKPDFGFIGNYYVPKEILHETQIFLDTEVEATAIFTGEKWKVIDMKKKQL